ncbi:MAG: OmpH family outer membrane protein [bacterium]|nr:OmpH family outer membrane protein [bacterium]MCP4799059.1 OmpH family outer membrane protein [bacterium]
MKTNAIRIIALTLLLLAFSSQLFADDVKPFAIIDSQRIVEEYNAARDAQEQYQLFLQDLEREITERERDLQRMGEEIESQKMLLGEDALRSKMEEFESARSDYFQFRESIDTRAEAEYKKQIQPIIDQIKLIAERIGKENGYGIIVDAAALTTIYIDPDVDLTDDILTALVKGVDE